MKTGGTSSSAQDTRSIKILRLAAVIIPITLVIYGMFIHADIIPSRNYVSDELFLLISFAWLTVSTTALLFPARSLKISALLFLTYFILGGLYSLFVSGFDAPIVIWWVLMLIAANMSLGRIGVQIGVVLVVAYIAIDAIVLHADEPSVQILDSTMLVAILISSIAIVSIHRSQQVDQKRLDNAIKQESFEHERILTLINNLADAILSLDTDGVVRVYNAASLNLLDTNGSLNGRHIDEIVTLHDIDNKPVRLFDLIKTVRSVTVRDDLRYLLGDDESMRIEATLSPIRSSYSTSARREEYDGYIVILRDVTKAKSLEEERDEFISVVSHELRTPITIAEGSISNAQFLLEHNAEQATLTGALAMAHDQTIFLAKMINDLSTLSRAERGVADASEIIDVKELANSLFHEYSPQAEEKNLQFNLDLGTRLGEVNVSRLYLHELLQNFITNAIKYTHEGSITLIVHSSASKVTFAVKDTGIGISKSDKEKVFGKFYRAEDYRTRETSGTGLGLYVATKLAKKLGCTIELQSRLNHGSTFSFTLPQHKIKKSSVKK